MPYLSFNQHGKRLMTVTFGVPKSFYVALASELGRNAGSGTATAGKRNGHAEEPELATDAEVEEYLRDVVKQNVEHLVEEHRPKTKPTFRLKRRPRG